jgi:hypothetical protein
MKAYRGNILGRNVMKKCFAILAIVFSVASQACQEEMESISEVTKFRVLGVQAEPPEISPGQGTRLEVLFADPKGEGREVTIAWLTCVGAFSPTSDLSEGCEPVWMPGLGTASQGGFVYEIPSVPPDILDNLAEGEEYVSVTAIVVLCAGGDFSSLDFADAGLTGEIDALDELCTGGDGLVAVKTSRVSTSTTPNTNPIVDSLVFDEKPLDSDPDASVVGAESPDAGDSQPGVYECQDPAGCMEGAKIQAFLTEESFEKYETEEFGETKTVDENPYISWFVTGGKFSEDRSRTNTPPGPFKVDWKPPRDGGRFQMWAVAHDMRGGLSWRSYTVEAKVPQ